MTEEIVRNRAESIDTLLDYRCGEGEFSMRLKSAADATDLWGVEIFEEKAEAANKKEMTAVSIDLDEDQLPVEDDYFDAIAAVDIIEHLYDPDHFLDEVERVLTPDGVLILGTPNLASIHNRLALLFGYQPFAMNVSRRYPVGHPFENDDAVDEQIPPSSHHFRPFTLRSLTELLELHGFEIDDIQGGGALIPPEMPFYSVVRSLDDTLSKYPSLAYETMITGSFKQI